MSKLRKFLQDIQTQKELKVIVYPGTELFQIMATLPFVASLKQQLPQVQIFLLLPPEWDWLVALLPQISGSWRYKKNFSHEEKFILKQWIKNQNFYVFVQFYTNWELSYLLWLCRIPFRIGELSHILAYLFFNLYFRKNKANKVPEYKKNLGVLTIWGLSTRYVFPEILVFKKKKGKYWLFCTELFFKNQPGYLHQDLLRATKDVKKKKIFLHIKENPPQNLSLPPNALIKKIDTYWDALKLVCESEFVVTNFNELAIFAAFMQIPHIVIYPKAQEEGFPKWATLPFSPSPQKENYLLQSEIKYSCQNCTGKACPHWPCVKDISLDKIKKAKEAWNLALREYQKNLKKQKQKEKEILKYKKSLEEFFYKYLEENEPRNT